MPNIFDISFELFVTEKDTGGPPVIGCRDFKALQPKDRAEFGALYAELEAQRRQPAEDPAAMEAEAEFQAAKAATAEPVAGTLAAMSYLVLGNAIRQARGDLDRAADRFVSIKGSLSQISGMTG
jgi:hypothetical protein